MKRILIVCLLLFSMGMANAQMIPLPGGAPAEINPNDYKSRHDFYQKAAYDYFNYMMGTKKAGTPGYESYVANQLLDEMYVYLRYEDPNDEAHGFVAKTVLMTDYYRLKKLNRESIDWQWSFLQEDIKSYEEAQNKYFKLLPKMSESDKFSVYVPLHQLGVQILKKGNTKEQSDYKLIDVFIFNALQYIKYNNDEGENSTLARYILSCTKCFPNKKSIYTYEKVYNTLKQMENKVGPHIFLMYKPSKSLQKHGEVNKK